MKKATVLQPFTTSKNEICLNGDVVYIDKNKLFSNRQFLGTCSFGEEQFGKYFKIEKLWE